LTGAQTVSSEEDLRFGDVLPGVPKTVAKTDPNGAAEFLVTGTEGAEVTIDFDLPLYFSTSGATMPVIFYDTDCAVDSTNPPDQSSPGYDNLNPYSTITYRLGSAGLRIYLGGKIVPGLVQKPGDYSATIRVTVTYTGN
jgi:hypothetical protein